MPKRAKLNVDVVKLLLEERQGHLRGLLLEGAASAPGAPADAAHFGALRKRVQRRARG